MEANPNGSVPRFNAGPNHQICRFYSIRIEGFMTFFLFVRHIHDDDVSFEELAADDPFIPFPFHSSPYPYSEKGIFSSYEESAS